MEKKMQLICLGYAGGEASDFRILEKFLGEEIELTPIEYSGHGSRSQEPFYKNCEEMWADIAEQIAKQRLPEIPYAILGYSMGAEVVYKFFAKQLFLENPVCAFLAAHEPPDVECYGKNISLENDKNFIEQIKRYGGVDERLLKEPRFAAFYMARLREDFRLLQEYQFDGVYHHCPVDMFVFFCEQDTPFQIMQGWERFAGKKIEFYEMGKNHFFFRSNPKEFCEIIDEKIEKYWNEYYE